MKEFGLERVWFGNILIWLGWKELVWKEIGLIRVWFGLERVWFCLDRVWFGLESDA